MRLFCLMVATLLGGCLVVPTHRGLSMDRTKVFTAPGSPQVFSATSRMEHRRGKAWFLSGGKHDEDDLFEETSMDSDTASRTYIAIVDPTTHAETRIASTEGEVEPLYFDAKRGILWLRDKDNVIHGASKGPVGSPDGLPQIAVATLEPPYVVTAIDAGSRGLFDLRGTDGIVLPPQIDNARTLVDGSIVRFTVIEENNGVVAVSQLAVDWSSGTPKQLPVAVWTTPPLPQDVERLALTVVGERYAEVVHDQRGTRLLVYQLVAGSQPLSIALPPAEVLGKLATLDADTLVFGVLTEGSKCWHGETIHIGSGAVTPLPESPCVTGTAITRGRYVLETEKTAAIVDASGKVVPLDGISAAALHDALAPTPTTRVLTVDADAALGEKQQMVLAEVNLETGEQRRTPLNGVGTKDGAKDVLLDVSDGVARFARGADTIITVPLGTAEPSVIKLPEPEMTAADRMPVHLNELWAGFGGGVTTRETGIGGLKIEIAHWVTDHWSVVGSASALFESAPSDKDPEWRELGPAFGVTWHRLPQLWSVNFGADLGANYADAHLDKVRTDRAFAPSFDVHVGASGSVVGIDLSALVPSLIDFDRGVQFWLSAKVGLTGAL